jgi:hypothetical protein
MRIRGMEKAGMDYEMSRQSDSAAPEIEHAASATRAWLAFRTVSDDSHSLELINRYDSHYQGKYREVAENKPEPVSALAPSPNLREMRRLAAFHRLPNQSPRQIPGV